MENQMDKENGENVVSIFGKKSKMAPEMKEVDSPEAFDAVMKKNKDVQERMRQERLKANRSVLRSYRIKT